MSTNLVLREPNQCIHFVEQSVAQEWCCRCCWFQYACPFLYHMLTSALEIPFFRQWTNQSTSLPASSQRARWNHRASLCWERGGHRVACRCTLSYVRSILWPFLKDTERRDISFRSRKRKTTRQFIRLHVTKQNMLILKSKRPKYQKKWIYLKWQRTGIHSSHFPSRWKCWTWWTNWSILVHRLLLSHCDRYWNSGSVQPENWCPAIWVCLQFPWQREGGWNTTTHPSVGAMWQWRSRSHQLKYCMMSVMVDE